MCNITTINFRIFSSSSKETLYPFPIPKSPSPRQPLTYPSVSMDLSIMDISCKWNHTVCVAFVTSVFHLA